MNKDQIMTIDVSSSVANLRHTLEMYGPQEMITDNHLRFYLAKAVTYAAAKVSAVDVTNQIHDRLMQGLSREEESQRRCEAILTEWVQLANDIKDNLNPYLYERNATFRGLMGCDLISIIIHEVEEED